MTYLRFRAVLLGAFAVLALLLAAVGLHGVPGQFIARRAARTDQTHSLC